jgi:excinuclease ABC subunit C
VISVKGEDLDIVGFARRNNTAAFYIFMMREGRIIESTHAFLPDISGKEDSILLSDRLLGYYGSLEDWPALILIPFAPTGLKDLSKKLSGLRGRKVELRIPRRGKNKRLLDFASTNALMLIRKRQAESRPLHELQSILSLRDLPVRIEGLDISNTSGKESVGSVVVFAEGAPYKDDYRRYKIKSVLGPNDVASLSEVISRRYRRVLAEGEPLPDLILVDGGKPQLHAAEKTLRELNLDSIPLASLAKREEIIFTPGHREGIRLDRTSPALKLLQSIRDEAHRFAITLHRRRREKQSFFSELDEIAGLGPRKKTILLARYKSLEAVRRAPAEEVQKLVGRPAAEALRRHLNLKIKP